MVMLGILPRREEEQRTKTRHEFKPAGVPVGMATVYMLAAKRNVIERSWGSCQRKFNTLLTSRSLIEPPRPIAAGSSRFVSTAAAVP